jgi:cyclopropane fatty-acyl-phospholipid synthase-like methyltransferase
MGLRSRLLAIPIVYEVFTNGLAGPEASSWLVNDVIEIEPDMKVLDVGCGTANILSALPDVEYLGVDHNPKYIDRAKSRFEKRGRFAVLDVNDPSFKDFGTYDRVLVLGVLHHLNDDEIKNLIRSLSKCLAKDGRLVTFDNSIIKGQHPVARFLAKADRGRFSRSP